MSEDNENIRDTILVELLPDVPFDGFSWVGVEQASIRAGYERDMARAVFSGGLTDVVAHFSDWADRTMLDVLVDTDIESLRVRDRIRDAVMARFGVLQQHKEAVRFALSYWAMPPRGIRASQVLWRTSDRIWDWAGDTATDYNRYTKRGLLSGVISSTTLAWFNDDDPAMSATKDFLDRRIENVMQLGRCIGKFKKAS